jgi:multidrug resistance efflux pump
MKAQVLDSTSSPSNGEVNYKRPVPSSSAPVRHWRVSIALSLGVLVLLASFVIAAINLRSHASPTSTPKTSAVTPAEDRRWYSLGYVDIEGGITPLYPTQLGRVKSVEAKENELVKAGTPLFQLEDTVPQLKVHQAQEDLEGAQKQLAIAEAGVDVAGKQIEAQNTAIAVARKRVEMARLAYNKQKSFEEKGLDGDKATVQGAKLAIEHAELGVQGEQKKLAVIEAEKRKAEGYVAAAKVNVAAKQAQLDEARNAVNECVVRAPVDGTPLRIFINKGEVLGANPRQAAIQFAPAKPLLVRAEVGQEFAGRVRLNQNVIIEDSVTNEECARGKVASAALWYAPRRTANAEIMAINSDTRTLECLIHIESTSRTLRIGQGVRVQFPD